jgi:hypothetical protein
LSYKQQGTDNFKQNADKFECPMHAFPIFFEHACKIFAILATHLKSVTLYYNPLAQIQRRLINCSSNEE